MQNDNLNSLLDTQKKLQNRLEELKKKLEESSFSTLSKESILENKQTITERFHIINSLNIVNNKIEDLMRSLPKEHTK